jgi:maltose alpha-D-glucosyltransferase/alpha-amylase
MKASLQTIIGRFMVPFCLQWSDEPHAGFTKNPKPHTPVIDKGPYGYQHVNAAVQRRDPESLLNWTERIIRMRKEVPEIGWGDFTVLKVRDPAVSALRYDWRNNSVLFLHNLHEQPREILVDPDVNSEQGKLLVNLLAENHSRCTESADSTICWVEPTSIKRMPARIEKRTQQRKAASALTRPAASQN